MIGGVPLAEGAYTDWYGTAVFPDVLLLVLIRIAAHRDLVTHDGLIHDMPVRRGNLLVAEFQHLFARVPEHAQGGTVRVSETAFHVDRDDGVRA